MNGYEWDLDENYYDIDYDVDFEAETEKTRITNDDFIIHRASENQFRAYIIKEINKINTILSTIKEVV